MNVHEEEYFSLVCNSFLLVPIRNLEFRSLSMSLDIGMCSSRFQYCLALLLFSFRSKAQNRLFVASSTPIKGKWNICIANIHILHELPNDIFQHVTCSRTHFDVICIGNRILEIPMHIIVRLNSILHRMCVKTTAFM